MMWWFVICANVCRRQSSITKTLTRPLFMSRLVSFLLFISIFNLGKKVIRPDRETVCLSKNILFFRWKNKLVTTFEKNELCVNAVTFSLLFSYLRNLSDWMWCTILQKKIRQNKKQPVEIIKSLEKRRFLNISLLSWAHTL